MGGERFSTISLRAIRNAIYRLRADTVWCEGGVSPDAARPTARPPIHYPQHHPEGVVYRAAVAGL